MSDRYFKTTITVTVLGVGPYEFRDLEQLGYDITFGDWSGKITEEYDEVTKEEMKTLLEEQGSDPEFLFGEEDEMYNDD